jgi:probable HAF family extracellular repeat protein
MIALAAGPASAQQWELVDLGTLEGGLRSYALAISPGGIVAGWASGAQIGKHPVIWVDGVIQDLGAPPGYAVGEARGVNDAGQVAVVAEGSPQTYHAFLWEAGTWTDLGLLPGMNESMAEDIDAAGRIVGHCFTLGGGNNVGFLWEDGVMTDLGNLGGYVRPYDINLAGQVVGRCRATQPGGSLEPRAFLWEAGTMTAVEPLPGQDFSQAFGISQGGRIAGSSWYTIPPYGLSVDRAARWLDDGEQIVDLGRTPGPPVCSGEPFYPDNIALAVNDNGLAVGHAQCIASGGSLAAFVWQDGVMHNLNDVIPPGSGWDLIKATDVNDAGQIVGFGLAPGGEYLRAFVLAPESTTAAPDLPVQSAATFPAITPNPFRRTTRIDFSLATPGPATLTVHDVRGRRVATLLDGVEGSGVRSLNWDGRDDAGRALAGGVYLLRFQAGDRVSSRRVVLLR